MSEHLFEVEAPQVPSIAAPVIPRRTERMMLDLLQQRYNQASGNGRRFVFAEHVRNQGGFGGFGEHDRLRTADALAIDLWPSSGHIIHGFEVKVSRADWLAELRDPSKAEAFKRHCNYWWLVVPHAAIVHDDLPPGWGLLTEARSGLRVHKQARKQTAEPMPLSMTAAWLRAAVKTAERGAS